MSPTVLACGPLAFNLWRAPSEDLYTCLYTLTNGVQELQVDSRVTICSKKSRGQIQS